MSPTPSYVMDRDARVKLLFRELKCVRGRILSSWQAWDLNFLYVCIEDEELIKTTYAFDLKLIDEKELQLIINKDCYFQLYNYYLTWAVYDYIEC